MKINVFFCLLFCINIYCQTINNIYEEGEKHKNNGNCLKAIECFSKVIDKDKHYYDAWINRAECYIQLKKNTEALSDLTTLINIKPNHINARILRAKLYINMNRYDEAISDLSYIIAQKPEYVEAYELRGLAYLKVAEKKSLAYSDLAKAKEMKSKNTLIYYELSKLEYEKKQITEAIQTVTEAINNDNKVLEYLYWRAFLYSQITDYKKAIEDLNICIGKGLISEKVYSLRAECAYNANLYEIALNDLTVLIENLKIKNPKYYLMRGTIFSRLNKPQNAISDFSKALLIDNKNEEAYLKRAIEYLKIGKTKENLAVKDLNKLIELNPRNAEAYLRRGIYFYNKKRYIDAFDDLNKSIKIKPSGEAYYYRGALFYEQNDLKNACNDLRKADELGFIPAKEKLNKLCPK
ncbi:MAG: tetratricopeptide repeat protein [Bacteroidales bacterium]|nr:tetratricopeptide repeat protein [Bacteroidales bacterium]